MYFKKCAASERIMTTKGRAGSSGHCIFGMVRETVFRDQRSENFYYKTKNKLKSPEPTINRKKNRSRWELRSSGSLRSE